MLRIAVTALMLTVSSIASADQCLLLVIEHNDITGEKIQVLAGGRAVRNMCRAYRDLDKIHDRLIDHYKKMEAACIDGELEDHPCNMDCLRKEKEELRQNIAETCQPRR